MEANRTVANRLARMHRALGLLVGGFGLATGTLAVIWRDPLALVAVAVGLGGMVWALLAHVSLRQRFEEDLEAVYAFTSAIEQAASTEELIEATLLQCRRLLGADFAEVVTSRGVESTATSLASEGGPVERRPGAPTLLEALSGVGEEESAVSTLAAAPAEISAHYAERGLTSGMVALLGGGSGTATMIVVGSRDPAGKVVDADLRLFEALARQGRLGFERGRLVDRLRREVGQKEHQALHDALTGLPNRLHFSIAVEDFIRRWPGRPNSRIAVLLIDLDRFKEVNDTLGHHRGDVLLQEMARRLVETAGGDDRLARLGGDEFGVVLGDVSEIGEAVEWGRRFGEVIHRPFHDEGLTVQLSASIGIALAPDHGIDGTTLLRRADVAMYEAKSNRSAVEVYDPQRDRYSTRRLAMASELRSAVENGALEVYYQPKGRLADGQIVGLEALCRWVHPRHGEVPPGEFIDLAERTGLIGPVTEHVLRTAFGDAMRLRSDGHSLSVAVNVAASSLMAEDFPGAVAGLIAETDIDPRTVTLEVTESTMMIDSVGARAALGELSEIGVALSIDDFGTGFSSLSQLSSLPVDEVKIDRSFVVNMTVDQRMAKIVTSTIGLVHSLGLQVVAEGVESRGIWDMLRRAGCDLAQGHYLARPMDFTDVWAWLSEGGLPQGDHGQQSPSDPDSLPSTVYRLPGAG